MAKSPEELGSNVGKAAKVKDEFDTRNGRPVNTSASLAKMALLLEEAQRRNRVKELADNECFDKQLAFIRDTSKRKILFTPRRSGKSTAIGIHILQEALLYPKRKFLYLALSKDSAQNAIWTPEFQAILDEYVSDSGYTYNSVKKVIKLKNGSTITLAGMDSSPQDMKRLLGGKYHMAIIDEMQDQTQDMKMLVEKVLSPAVSDYLLSGGGIIVLAGTPGSSMGENYWFQLTKTDKEGNPDPTRLPGWSIHHWEVIDNPYQRKQFGLVCEELAATVGPNYQEDPTFITEWLGRWVLDPGVSVYKFREDRNVLCFEDKAPNPKLESEMKIKKSLISIDPNWTYIVAVDLGWEDATAFVVGAFSRNDNTFYIVESSKQNHTVVSEIGAIMLMYNHKYRPMSFILDTGGGGKLVAESLASTYRLPIVAAKKTEKEAFIATMNSDFITGNIKVIPELNKDLIIEWQTLIVDRKKRDQGIFKEAEKYDNHLADAALYCYKASMHKLAIPAPPPREKDFADLMIERKKRTANPFIQKDSMDLWEEQMETKEIIRRFRNGR